MTCLQDLEKQFKEVATMQMTQHELRYLRHKHSGEIAQLNNQLDMVKKSKASAEKSKSKLEAELADLTNELKSVSSNKQEAERMRKQLESHVGEAGRPPLTLSLVAPLDHIDVVNPRRFECQAGRVRDSLPGCHGPPGQNGFHGRTAARGRVTGIKRPFIHKANYWNIFL